MRRRAHHRNLVVWSSSAGSAFWDGAPRLTRTRRIRRWIRTGALLMVIGLIRSSLTRAPLLLLSSGSTSRRCRCLTVEA